MKTISNLREKNPLELLHLSVVFLAIGAALAQFGRFFVIAFSRAAFPFTLEWMEGGSFIQVSRILAGQPIYVRPSFDFIPQIYPPVYFYISALVSRLLGNEFLPLRLVSILSTLGILVLIYVLVYDHSGSKLAGLMASGLFVSTYELSGYWFDIARVDSLALAFLLLAAYFILKDKPSASILGGIFLVLACFTKQTMLIVAGVIVVSCLLPPRKNSLFFVGTAVLGFLGGTLLLDWYHESWYSYYIFHLPGRHNILPNIVAILNSTKDILFIEMVKPTFFAVVVGLLYLLLFPGKARTSESEDHWNKNVLDLTWPRRTVWILVLIAVLLAAGSLWYLAQLPSSAERGLIGPYSLLRLLLMAGPISVGALVVFLAITMKKNPVWEGYIAKRLFWEIHTVPRILLGFILLTSSAVIILAYVKPDVFNELNETTLQRLSPYLVGPVVLLVTLVVAWRFLWLSNRLGTWFYLLLSVGLITVSWLGRLNPGGYYNAFMPAFAGISILFGLGIGLMSANLSRNTFPFRNIFSTLVLFFSSVQLFALLSPMSMQIPTQADKEAGLEFVSRIQACPGDVYIPFHTYLAELAGKKGYAGVVEMGELRGSFGGKRDPLWDEVLNQIGASFDKQIFAAVIQDNQIFRDAMSSNYLETGKVFENDLIFWQVTGRKLRPQVIYQPAREEKCFLPVE